MSDEGAVRSADLYHLSAMVACKSLWPGRFELKAWKWVMRSIKVEFSL
jgi:hypothetical protein